MRYYLVETNPKYFDAPRLIDFGKKINIWSFYHDKSYNMEMRTVVNIKPNKYLDFVDFIFQPVPLISERMRETILKFESEFIIKEIILFDPESGRSKLYYIPFFHRFDESVFVSPILDDVISGSYSESIRLKLPFELPVFYVVYENTCLLFMRIDIMESLLRNGVRGVIVREATAEEGENNVIRT